MGVRKSGSAAGAASASAGCHRNIHSFSNVQFHFIHISQLYIPNKVTTKTMPT